MQGGTCPLHDGGGIAVVSWPRDHTSGLSAVASIVSFLMRAGRAGIGHVRYPTAGTPSAQEAQPFFVNSPLGIFLIHNGNITNAQELRSSLNSSESFFNRHLRTDSDSEVRERWHTSQMPRHTSQ